MLSSHYLMSIEIITGARVEEPATSEGDVRDTDSTRGLGRSPGEGNGNPARVFFPGESRGPWRLEDYSP